MKEFHFSAHSQEIIFGMGSSTRILEAVDRFGWERLMLFTSGSLAANGRAAAVETVLGARLVGTYDRVRPHVQDTQAAEALALADEKKVDAVVGLGGGSPIGMAKAVSYGLREKRTVPIVAIPATYAGSEMTAVYGITHTDQAPPRKVTVSDARIAPRLVVYDPELTLDLPPELTASTGINALAHCVEALYSSTRHPLSSAAAARGAHHIWNALLRCWQYGSDIRARTEMLLGAHLAGYSLASVKMGLHHGLCHVLGGSAGVPHGIANSIILPHAVRFNAETTAAQLLPAAEAMGIPTDGISPGAVIESLADHISELTRTINLPQRLRDAGVKQEDLPRLAELAFQNRAVQNNPKPVAHAAELERLLSEAW